MRDVVDGFVSVEKARADYGVVVGDRPGELSIDWQQTFKERAFRKTEPANMLSAAK